MSYNILCDKYTNRQIYGWCPSWALLWTFRRDLIFNELRDGNADIISLQVGLDVVISMLYQLRCSQSVSRLFLAD